MECALPDHTADVWQGVRGRPEPTARPGHPRDHLSERGGHHRARGRERPGEGLSVRFFIRPAFEVAARVLTLHPPPHPTPLNPNPPTPIRPRPRPQPVRHSYGKTLVPFNKIDEEQMSVANEKCMSILGFAKSSEVRGGQRCAGLSRRHGSLTRTPKGGSNTGPRRSRKSSWSATRSRFRPSRRTLSPTRRCRPSSTPFTSSTASRSCATAAPTVRGGSLVRPWCRGTGP